MFNSYFPSTQLSEKRKQAKKEGKMTIEEDDAELVGFDRVSPLKCYMELQETIELLF